MSGVLRLRAEALEWRLIDGEVVALDLRTEQYLALNRSGARCWVALAEGAETDQLAALLVEAYGIAPEQANQDVATLVADLRAASLLDDGDDAPA